MKQQWKNLNALQKQYIYWGSLFILIIFFLMLLFPIHNMITQLRAQIVEDKDLLILIVKSKEEILNLRHGQAEIQNQDSLFGLVDKALKASNIGNQVSEFKQSSNAEVKVTFNKIAFDDLITWLEFLGQKYHIIPYRITINETNNVGFVSADITLKTGNL